MDVPSWELRRGECWLVLGVNGSGKSTLLEVISGKSWPLPGKHDTRHYYFGEEASWSPLTARDHVALLTPSVQNRYQHQDWNLTAGEVVATGFDGTDLLHRELSLEEYRCLRQTTERLGIEALENRLFLELSQGERRKVLIARALVREPAVLLLDEFTEGLDPESQSGFWGLLDRIANAGTSVVLTTHRAPGCLLQGHWRVLQIRQGTASEVPRDVLAAQREKPPVLSAAWQRASPPLDPDALVSIRAGALYLGGHLLVRLPAWDISQGNHWVLLGGNGSGKTSLLRLLWGELHLAHGGQLLREGLSNRTMHSLREEIGFFQPDFHAWVPAEDTVHEVIVSGFFASIGLLQMPSASQRASAVDCASRVNVGELLERRFGALSYGQARRALLARALVHRPRFLLLDEPLDGLDSDSRQAVQQLLEDAVADGKTTLVMTSHHADDIPPWIPWAGIVRNQALHAYRRSLA